MSAARWQIWYYDYFDRDREPSLEAEGIGLAEGLTVLWRKTLDEAFCDDGRPTFTSFIFKCSPPIEDIPRDPLRNPELGRLRIWRHDPGVLEAIVHAHARVGVTSILAAAREAANASELVARLREL